MSNWHLIWVIPSLIFSLGSYLPLINSQHWIFRSFDFVRLQILVILVFFLLVGTFLNIKHPNLKVFTLACLIISISYNFYILYPYFPKSQNQNKIDPDGISFLSLNVMQKNTSYNKVISTINKVKPDILLTMETDKKWETALEKIEDDYKHTVKVPKSNRYGIHLYTKLKILDSKIHYLISKEHPSIEVRLIDEDGNEFVLWGIHPPPPSPTEKPTSKQKEGELMQLAKLIHQTKLPVIVAGDFNNVSWSNISKLFVKITRLKDARIGKGFNSTFPADYPLLRFPIDLLFHSNNINIDKLKVLEPVGSDHLPLYSNFEITDTTLKTKKRLDSETKDEMAKKIRQGKKAATIEN